MSEKEKKASKKKYFDNVSIGKRTKQTVYFSLKHDKAAMFEMFLENNEIKQTVVLTKSKRSADELNSYLKDKNINTTVVHGNHRTEQIEESAKAFMESDIKILISTDMILKSLELTNIEVIINYELPIQAAEYFVRLAYVDEVGQAVSFVSPEEESTLATIEFMMKNEMTELEFKDFLRTEAPLKNTTNKDKKKKLRHKKQKQKKQTSPKE